ncbi:hypothetical protein HY497_02105 [Candidatus Woesearchaeota archaeon]|nr:hypothetical protein [Candidatus Woesearchaeota archaeon]
MAAIISLFLGINLYAFFVGQMTRMLRGHHGAKKGFIISNIIILGTFALVLLFALQFRNL